MTELAEPISRGRRALRRFCRIEAKPIAEVNRQVEDYQRFWEGHFQRLEVLLDNLKANRAFDEFTKPELLKRWFGPNG